jgi:hypothetical protein
MTNPRGRNERKVKNFLIFGEYQLHYAAHMATVSAALTAGLGWLVWHFNREAARVVDLRAFDPTDVEALALAQTFHRGERNLVIGLICFGVLLAAALAVWQIVTTHKVAGPLYYVAHQTRRIRDGFLGEMHPLRRGDMLHGFFEEFRAMVAAIRARAVEERDQLGRLAEQARSAGQGALADELAALAKRHEEALR